MAASLEDRSGRTRQEALKAKRPSKPILKFRNYNPQTEQLQDKKLPRAKPESIESQVQEQLQSGQESDTLKDVNLSKLAPKKADWDLKRDIAKKLEKLERRTQKSIVELIRNRLQEDSNALASAVAVAEHPTTSSKDDDDSD